mmetsp:Transcript_92245/g.154772  ORF Transcript_92245/g.154772 Transcript_92245/m.154772 type:complete len:114 (+) Transcript_92245:283-624(+)
MDGFQGTISCSSPKGQLPTLHGLFQTSTNFFPCNIYNIQEASKPTLQHNSPSDILRRRRRCPPSTDVFLAGDMVSILWPVLCALTHDAAANGHELHQQRQTNWPSYLLTASHC